MDIAVYKLAYDAGLQTKERRVRYEDALQGLKDLSKGVSSLVLPGSDEDRPNTPNPIYVEGVARERTSSSMKGVL